MSPRRDVTRLEDVLKFCPWCYHDSDLSDFDIGLSTTEDERIIDVIYRCSKCQNAVYFCQHGFVLPDLILIIKADPSLLRIYYPVCPDERKGG